MPYIDWAYYTTWQALCWVGYRVTHSFNKYLLSVSYVSSTLLDAGDKGKNETKPLYFGSLGFTGGDRQ